MNYQEIRRNFESMEGTKLTLLDKDNADEFDLPKGYRDFLKQVGFGRIGKSDFQFYNGVVFVDEIHGYTTPVTESLLIFGDDYQGSCIGFDKKDWSIVRVKSDQSLAFVATDFKYFIEIEFMQLLKKQAPEQQS